MSFLAPGLLLLGLAAAIPVLLHLLQRQQGPRMAFPALRYLRRAEREHATRIRLRQILLLALRVLALLLLAAAAARPLLRGTGAGHEPTSVVLVLDNSLSSGAVVGDARVLDVLREAALRTVDAAGSEDRFWLIRAGATWEPARAGDATSIRDAILGTEPGGGAADLGAEIARAVSILASEPAGRATEIHVLSDLQASAFRAERSLPDGGPPVVLLDAGLQPPLNRAVTDVQLGGGMAPRSGERSTVTASIHGDGTDSVTARLVLEGAVRAAIRAAPGATAVMPFPASDAGLVTGHVEIDADALVADDRRHFVARIEPPPAVGLGGPAPFVDEALDVLEQAGRIRRSAPAAAAVVVAPGGAGAEAVRAGRDVIVLPPASPLEIAASNQRMAAAGIPWRFGPPRTGEARLMAEDAELGPVLAEARLRQVYDLERQGAPDDSVLIRMTGGEPWAVAGRSDGGRYAVLATPLTLEGGTIPTSAAMLPLLDRALGSWVGGRPAHREYRPGDVITLPGGDSLTGPVGSVGRSTAGEVYRLERPGVYRVFRDGAVVEAFPVNPEPAESELTRLGAGAVLERLGGRGVRIADVADWDDATFQRRTGREIGPPLVLLAILVLLAEAAIAATGRGGRQRTPVAEPAASPAPEGTG